MLLTSRLRYVLYGALASASLISLSVQAATNDGVFGDYFTNIIINCPSISIVTGFDPTPSANYGKTNCTPLQTLLGSIFSSSAGGPGQAVVGFNPDGTLKYALMPDTNWKNNAGNISYTGGNVGIGTATPAAKLDIASGGDAIIRLNKTSGTSWNYIEWSIAGTRRYWTGIDSAGVFNIASDASTAVAINPYGGNVGIGTTTPGTKLDVAGNIKSDSYLVTAGNGNAICFWADCTNYTISMGNGSPYTYGSVNDYSIKMQMNAGSANRGFTWGRQGVAPIASLNSTSGDFQTAGDIRSGKNVYTDGNYGYGLIGLYDATKYQGVFAMGDSYKLPANGSSPGNLYGIAWTHSNAGGQSKAGLEHQALFMMNGVTQTAIGNGIWTAGNLTVSGNVGIGTATPVTKLDVAGDIRSTGNMTAIGNITAGTTSSRIFLNDTDESLNGAKSIHANSNVIGFLNGQGSWMTYWDHFGNQVNMGAITAGGTIYANGGISDSAGARMDAGGGWLRTYGKTGWYNGTYNVGMHAIQDGYVQTYNNAGIMAGDIIANGFLRVTGDNRILGNSRIDGNLRIDGSLRLPAGGVAGRYLTSDNAGNASWAALPSGVPGGIAGNTLYHNGANWVASSNIFNNNGDVGIGTATPGAKLDVTSNVAEVANFSSTTPNAYINFYGAGMRKAYISATGSNLSIMNLGSGALTLGTDGVKPFVIDNGFVGIGTNNPTANLDIGGTMRFRNGGGEGKVLTSDNDGNTRWADVQTVLESTNNTYAIPPGYAEVYTNMFGEDTRTQIPFDENDTCDGSRDSLFTCPVDAELTCSDSYRSEIGRGGVAKKYTVQCAKTQILMKRGNICAPPPACLRNGTCSIVSGTPSSPSQPWVIGAPSCRLTCTNGYTGNQCQVPPCEDVVFAGGPACETTVPVNPTNGKNRNLYRIGEHYGSIHFVMCDDASTNPDRSRYSTATIGYMNSWGPFAIPNVNVDFEYYGTHMYANNFITTYYGGACSTYEDPCPGVGSCSGP